MNLYVTHQAQDVKQALLRRQPIDSMSLSTPNCILTLHFFCCFSCLSFSLAFYMITFLLYIYTDLGDNATIEKIGPPEKVINAFGPEMIGENVEGKVLSANVAEHEGRTYYQFELEPPHIFITATAAGNRLYLFGVTGSGIAIYPLLNSFTFFTSSRLNS